MSKNKKFMVSVDIEGISGVATSEFSSTDDRCYEKAKKLMCLNTNSVIEGILKADNNAQIIVRDAHGRATNLIFEDLHPAANLIQGWGNSINMIQGIDSSYDALFLVGYHAGAQNRSGVLSHTLCSALNWIKINGNIVNEAGWAGVLADHYNVPVVFLSGDDQAVIEAKAQFKNIETVEVKKSMGRDCALSYPLESIAKQLQESACKAVQNVYDNKATCLNITLPIEVELKFFDNGYLKSRYQYLFEILNFDKSYFFNHEESTIIYQTQSQLEAFQKGMLLFSIFSNNKFE